MPRIGGDDVNRDGRTDPAVFRPATGMWLVRGVGHFRFGANGDVPVPGAYNGAGISDTPLAGDL